MSLCLDFRWGGDGCVAGQPLWPGALVVFHPFPSLSQLYITWQTRVIPLTFRRLMAHVSPLLQSGSLRNLSTNMIPGNLMSSHVLN
jgi:hypothetical protein